MTRTSGLVVLAVSIWLVSLTLGCGRPSPRGSRQPAVESASGVTLNGAGATFPYPLYSKWFQTYHAAHPGVSFNYQAVGSGAGVAQYRAGTVDFGASDAPLTDAELAQMPRPTLHLPLAAGAVVVVYNVAGVAEGLKLSGDVLADVFLGKISRWNDPRIATLNPGTVLPDSAIAVIHRSDGSGTTHIFTTYLSAVSAAWKQQVGSGKSVNWPVGLGGNQNAGVAGLVQRTPGAIGYVELAYAVQNRLAGASLRNRAGSFVAASTTSTSAAADACAALIAQDPRASIVDAPGASSYPISGLTYLLVPKAPADAAKGNEMREFLGWALGAGQKMAAALLYAPLPPSVVRTNLKALEG